MDSAINDDSYGDDDEFDEEFRCPACRDLMVLPTVLSCGHSLCQLCLAKSSIATNHRTCPTCQQPWGGFPTINLPLRNMIARRHGDLLVKRERETLHEANNKRIIQVFKAKLTTTETTLKKTENAKHFWAGAVVAFAVTVAVVLLPCSVYCWLNSDGDPVTQKPVAAWRTWEVEHWLDSLMWTRDYIPYVQEHEIDGPMLLRMDELELVQLLNVTDRVQQNAMQTAIRAIREHGVKMPETLWEYKALYPGRTLFFLLSLEHFPRCTIVLSNLFYYDEVFLPLLHSTTPVEWGDRPEADWGKLPRPKTSQWILFYLWTVMLPNWKLALFAWSFRWEHYVVLVPVLLHFLVGTFLDIHVTIELFLRRNLKLWLTLIKVYAIVLAFGFVLFVGWPMMPLLIPNYFFYCGFITPFWRTYQLFLLLRQAFNDHFKKEKQ